MSCNNNNRITVQLGAVNNHNKNNVYYIVVFFCYYLLRLSIIIKEYALCAGVTFFHPYCPTDVVYIKKKLNTIIALFGSFRLTVLVKYTPIIQPPGVHVYHNMKYNIYIHMHAFFSYRRRGTVSLPSPCDSRKSLLYNMRYVKLTIRRAPKIIRETNKR